MINQQLTAISGLQVANNGKVGYASCKALAQRPRNLPNVAPTTIEGIKIPAGT